MRKAESDLTAAEVCLAAGKALDTACFHCQQAAEKAIKSWLIASQVSFPFVHDLGKLLALCAQTEPDFQTLEPLALSLNPFAVEMRYDDEFWPTAAEVEQSVKAARSIYDFIFAHFPPRPNSGSN